MNISSRVLELPIFQDGINNIDAYLQRFERFAKLQNWETADYAMALSTLLTGQALEVYARLSNTDATDYTKIKTALFKNYSLTEEGFRVKFRHSKPKDSESPEQYLTRIETYCESWLATAEVKTCDDLKNLILREQVLNMCPRNLEIHLTERSFTSISDMCKQADRYLEARNQKMTTGI